LDLINAVESILVEKSPEEEDKATASQKRHDLTIRILTTVTLVTNIVRLTGGVETRARDLC
jgi:hypothetical protein